MLITALYDINTYTVTFIGKDGSVLKTEDVQYGQDATPPTPPDVEGYTFTGWSAEYTSVKANLEITAIYEVVPPDEEDDTDTEDNPQDDTDDASGDASGGTEGGSGSGGSDSGNGTNNGSSRSGSSDGINGGGSTDGARGDDSNNNEDKLSSLLTSIVRIVTGGSLGTINHTFTQANEEDDIFSLTLPVARPARAGYYFAGYRSTHDGRKYESGDTVQGQYIWGDYDYDAIWVPILGRGTFSLSRATEYRFAEGRWHVAGDSTSYEGGQSLYVNNSGTYDID